MKFGGCGKRLKIKRKAMINVSKEKWFRGAVKAIYSIEIFFAAEKILLFPFISKRQCYY